eukprot:6231437-Amphidinium_carterae.1
MRARGAVHGTGLLETTDASATHGQRSHMPLLHIVLVVVSVVTMLQFVVFTHSDAHRPASAGQAPVIRLAALKGPITIII